MEPLRVGSLGDILLTREEYKSEEFDEQDWITLERCLSLASEIRKKMVLISNFLQQNSDRNYFMQHKCVKPIRDVLQNFIEEITESVQRKRSVFKGFLKNIVVTIIEGFGISRLNLEIFFLFEIIFFGFLKKRREERSRRLWGVNYTTFFN